MSKHWQLHKFRYPIPPEQARVHYDHSMIWLLACTASKESGFESNADSRVESAPESQSESQPDSEPDSPHDSDTAPPEDIEPGPDCSASNWPIGTALNVLGDRLVRGVATDQDIADLDTLISDFIPQTPGPWVHKVIGPFVASDGVEFSDSAPTIWQQGSVPELVVGPDGDRWLFFVDGNLDRLREWAVARQPVGPGLRGLGGLTAVRQDQNGNFAEVELSFTGHVPLYVVDPDIVLGEDGIYRLYFLGIEAEDLCSDTPDPFSVPGGHGMYLATSTDLLHWQMEGIAFETTNGGTDPGVWCIDGDTCYAMMTEVGESTDGGMTFLPGSIGITGMVQLPDIHATSTGWRMYDLRGMDLGTRVSTDGVNWTDEGTIPVIGSSPTALIVNGQTELYLSVQ